MWDICPTCDWILPLPLNLSAANHQLFLTFSFSLCHQGFSVCQKTPNYKMLVLSWTKWIQEYFITLTLAEICIILCAILVSCPWSSQTTCSNNGSYLYSIQLSASGLLEASPNSKSAWTTSTQPLVVKRFQQWEYLTMKNTIQPITHTTPWLNSQRKIAGMEIPTHPPSKKNPSTSCYQSSEPQSSNYRQTSRTKDGQGSEEKYNTTIKTITDTHPETWKAADANPTNRPLWNITATS